MNSLMIQFSHNYSYMHNVLEVCMMFVCVYIPITRGRLDCIDVAGIAHSVAASRPLLSTGSSEKVAVCSMTVVAVAVKKKYTYAMAK